MTTVTVVTEVAAPVERVFEVFTDKVRDVISHDLADLKGCMEKQTA